MDQGKIISAMKRIARSAGKKALVVGLTLYYCMLDRDTPIRIKTLILGDLAYFISPIDAIPDIIPFWGYTDDVALMTATLAYIAVHVKGEHREKARALADSWLRASDEKIEKQSQ